MAISQAMLDGNGRGFVLLLDVTFDDFATVAHRYSTKAYATPGNDPPQYTYDPRIVSVGTLQSGFSLDGLPAPATVDLVLANTDGLADWLADRTDSADVNKARFRLKVAMWDTSIAFADFPPVQTQQVGVFVMLDWPKRYVDRVKLTLADDAMGKVDDGLVAPSIRDWVGNVVANFPAEVCPLKAGSPVANLDWDAPFPLAFGMPLLKCYSAANDYTDNATANQYLAIPLCATTDTSGTPGVVTMVQALNVGYRSDIENANYFADIVSSQLGIPATWVRPAESAAGSTPTIVTNWECYLSHTITKNGVDWRLIWVRLNIAAYISWFQRTFPIQGTPPSDVANSGNNPPWSYLFPTAKGSGVGWAGNNAGVNQQLPMAAGAFDAFYVASFPLSARTVTTSTMQNASDIIKDLISYYSKAAIGDIDTASFARAKAATSQLFVGGVVNPYVQPNNTNPIQAASPVSIKKGVMRQVLQDICASSDIDLYVRRLDNRFALACSFFSYDDIVATHPSIPESRTADVEEARPSVGARWFPYNRVYLTSSNNETWGPYDNPQGLATLGGEPRSKTLSGKWMVLVGTPFTAEYLLGLWGLRNLETKVRPVIRFRTDKSALALDLDSFFSFNWTRGTLGGPFVNTIFKVERMVIDPSNLSIDIEAVWVDDLVNESAYLLDDENLVIITSGSGGPRTVTVADGSSTLTFSSGDLVANGVLPGHIILLQDPAEPDGTLQRNRALRIASVTNALHLVVTDPDLNFAGGGTFSYWTILPGATTYPTAISDPGDYPDGSAMYGKAGNDSSQYSNATNANTLKEG